MQTRNLYDYNTLFLRRLFGPFYHVPPVIVQGTALMTHASLLWVAQEVRVACRFFEKVVCHTLVCETNRTNPNPNPNNPNLNPLRTALPF